MLSALRPGLMRSTAGGWQEQERCGAQVRPEQRVRVADSPLSGEHLPLLQVTLHPRRSPLRHPHTPAKLSVDPPERRHPGFYLTFA